MQYTHKMYETITASAWSVTLWLAFLIGAQLPDHILFSATCNLKLLSDPTSLAIIIYPLPPSRKASHVLTGPFHDQHSRHWTTSAETSPRKSHDIARNLKADGCGVRIGASPWVTALSHEFVMETQPISYIISSHYEDLMLLILISACP